MARISTFLVGPAPTVDNGRGRRHHGSDADPGHRDPARQAGQVLALFAIGLTVLLGAAGLGVDGGRLMEERRAAQAAVDHAATATAYASCTGGDEATARTAGRAAASRNGYDHAAATIDVLIDPIYGQPNAFIARIHSTIPGTFSRAIGIDNFTVSVEATAGAAGCNPGATGPGAIYAGGTCEGKWGVDIGASDSEILGGVHSNGEASTSGSRNKFHEVGDPDDPFTYVGTHQNGGSNNVFQTPYPRSEGSRAWPADWEAADITGATTGAPAVGSFLRPYYDLAVVNGTYSTNKIETINKDGVYYTTSEDGMDISNIVWSGIGDRTVVLVATRGPIKISISPDVGKTLRAFNHASLPRQNVLALSNETFGSEDDRCSKFAINVSGQRITWDGMMWAPGGMIEFSGSDNTTINGSLVGWSVKISGQNLHIRFTPSGSPPTAPTVLLLG